MVLLTLQPRQRFVAVAVLSTVGRSALSPAPTRQMLAVLANRDNPNYLHTLPDVSWGSGKKSLPLENAE